MSKKETAEAGTATVSTAEAETVTVPKDQFDKLVQGYEDLQKQLAFVNNRLDYASDERKAVAAEKERELLAVVEKANAEAKEKVKIHVDLGAAKSNPNEDVSINGVQYVVKKGETVEVPKAVAEVIANAKEQREISNGVQKKMQAQYAQAASEGGFNGVEVSL